MNKELKYTNGTITVVWKPDKCEHSARCVKNLPCVFNVNKRPWIDIDGASTEEIAQVVDMCPSGALSYYYNKVEK